MERKAIVLKSNGIVYCTEFSSEYSSFGIFKSPTEVAEEYWRQLNDDEGVFVNIYTYEEKVWYLLCEGFDAPKAFPDGLTIPESESFSGDEERYEFAEVELWYGRKKGLKKVN